MSRLDELQRSFAEALLDPGQAPVGLDPEGRADALRFGVYRNNVAASLIEALEAAYPAIRRLVGEVFFRACAAHYVTREPPRSPVMLHYGESFPGFLRRFEPLAGHPYLADVAGIERAWLEAYHAAEAEPLDPATLAGVAEHRAGDLCFTLHPSVRIVRSAYPALTLWHANVTEADPPPIKLDSGAEDALIVRPNAEVEVRAMPPGGAAFLEALARGETLTVAAAQAISVNETFTLSEHIAALLAGGLFTAARLRGPRSAHEPRKQSVCP